MRESAAELVSALADEGIEYLFINPGTDTAPVQEWLEVAREEGMPHPDTVLCTHEFVALSAAMGHYLASGRPQAVMVHVDAGTLNLGGAIHNAQRNRVPVVVLAGRSPYAMSADVPGHRDSPIHWQQEQLDQQAVLRAFGKWTMEVPRGRDLGPIVRRAFQIAQSDPKGPSYVVLPRETLMDRMQGGPSKKLRPPSPAAPDPEALAELARILAEAERPVIITGRTGECPSSVTTLVEIAELIGCPVMDKRDRVSFPADHALYAGSTSELLREADAVLLLDVEVPWVPAGVAPPASAAALQIDIDCSKLTMPSWNYAIDLAITADTRRALPCLRNELSQLATTERREWWAQRRERTMGHLKAVGEYWRKLGQSSEPESAADAMLATLNRALPWDAIVLEEAVTNREAVHRQILRAPGYYYATGSPALGWGLAGALGVKLANSSRTVITICGDGAFNFGLPNAALWSAHRAGAPFLAVILNNGAYQASRLHVEVLYPGGIASAKDSFPETDLSPSPDYVQLARAYGAEGVVVTCADEMSVAVEHCLDFLATQNRCAILDVRLAFSCVRMPRAAADVSSGARSTSERLAGCCFLCSAGVQMCGSCCTGSVDELAISKHL